MKLELPRGMRDIESDDLASINFVREKFLETARRFNFRMMEPSPLELLSTLEAKSGASISNEIYAFKDKGGRDVALRFDLTIGLTRHVAARRDLKMPAKIAAFAGVWRYDEPQAGRYRYFHQWDIEVYGPFSQESDAEVIEFISAFFDNLGLPVTIQINDRQLVEEYIRKVLGITEEEKVLEIFRAVDKVPKKGAHDVLAEYKDAIEPTKLQSLIEFSKVTGQVDEVAVKAGGIKGLQSWQKLSGLMDSLASRGVANAAINLGIVRGLDYYSGIVFEVFDASGDGGALVGGGRYDRLTDTFGRKDIGATGAAGGIERIVIALQKHNKAQTEEVATKLLAYVACATDDAKARALKIASALRNAGIATDYDMLGRALRRQMDDASAKGASVAIIVAPTELAENKVTVKSMKDGSETKHDISGLVETVSKMLQ
ncbi:MAG TPA: histidine--tRNA ligase [Nitrososphaera sp.]|nr:histidine--tRNA ligase [Nitrososphaera sp.]